STRSSSRRSASRSSPAAAFFGTFSAMRILIIHASAGNGHKRAAEAIAAAYKVIGGHDVDVIDALDWAPAKFKGLYQGSFETTVKHAPWFFGAMFHGSS